MLCLYSLRQFRDADFLCQTERSLEKRLAGALPASLRPFAGEFAAASRRYGVSAVTLASIAGLESDWGRACPFPNDLFGLRRRGFDRPEQSISYAAAVLRTDYLTPGGRCYRGPELEDVGVCFAPSDPGWAAGVRRIMALLLERMRQSLAEELVESGFGVRPPSSLPGYVC